MSRSAPAPMRIAAPPEGRAPRRTGPSARPRTWGDDLTSMELGLISLALNPLLVPSIIAVVVGRRALRTGTGDRTRALIGVISGWVALGGALLAVVLGVVAALILPFLVR